MKKNLLLVESPFQLLSAYEAIKYFKLQNYLLLIRYSGLKKNDQQIDRLLQVLQINPVNIESVFIKESCRGVSDFLKFIFYMFKYFIKRADFESIYIGSYRSRFFRNVLKQFLNEKKIILLDDGNQTIEVQKEFTSTENFDLFTMYSLEAYQGQKVYLNQFKALSKLIVIDKNSTEDNILFIGCGLSEAGIISSKKYIQLIEKVAEYYGERGKTMVYLPHRNEQQLLINELVKINNLNLKTIDYPIEFIGLYDGMSFSKVSSFYSTALITMRDIYNLEAECFFFDYTASKYQRDIDLVYDYYKKEMKLIQLD
ncbi:MAG: hypothetical protein ACJAS9_002463 [Polaribacter sp.]|jgi:hypothetical protein